jgi:hypothetical protein
VVRCRALLPDALASFALSFPRALVLALACAWTACGAPAGAGQSAPESGDPIRFRGAEQCDWLQFRASTPAALRPTPLAELVVAVNGEVCHREGVPGNATVHGELAALCPEPDLFEPGSNLVEVVLMAPGCGAGRPLARRRVECAAPGPD